MTGLHRCNQGASNTTLTDVRTVSVSTTGCCFCLESVVLCLLKFIYDMKLVDFGLHCFDAVGWAAGRASGL